jgi:hypothetical protein
MPSKELFDRTLRHILYYNCDKIKSLHSILISGSWRKFLEWYIFTISQSAIVCDVS